MRKFWYDWGALVLSFLLGIVCMNLANNEVTIGWLSPTLITLIGYICFTFATTLIMVKPFEYLDALLNKKVD